MKAETFIRNTKAGIPMINTASGVKVKPSESTPGESYLMTSPIADLFIVANRFERLGDNSIEVYYNNLIMCRIEPSRYVEYDPTQEGF